MLVVVDGSNLATEGRTLPSLAQLRECVAAFQHETPSAKPVVIVDATFGHRIAPGERARFKEAELAGELVTPPAGAIGRGDAFILKIAAQSGAVVLSNDSFQEFQAEHPWLFEEGRLIGGKPVPGIGWVFTPRNPVRAPKSRSTGGRDDATPKVAQRAPAPAKAAAAAAPVAPAPAAPSRRRGRGTAASAPTVPAATAATGTPTRTRKTAAKAAPKPAPKQPTKSAVGAEARPRKSAAAKAAPRARAAAPEPTRRQRQAPPAKKASAGRPAKAAPVPAKTPRAAPEPAAKRSVAATRDDTPVNPTRAFHAMTSRHPVRSHVEGEVASFTSHGAMITVTVGRGTKVACYVPLAGLGRPAPTRARDVLKLGERRTFRVVAYDEVRRIAELSLTASG